VVWLNDLERWLGPDGLDLGVLRRLLGDGHRRVVVVATMRASEYAARAPEQEQGRADPERELRRAEQDVLDQAARVELERQFTRPERERAEQRAWDPRIADALAHAGAYGLAEYLAAGPRLWQRWRDGLAVDNPPERLAGAAIVAVAVDCRRAGLTRPVPVGLLRDLYLGYLDSSVGRRLDPGAFAAGLTWATRPIQATSALLSEEEQGYVVFDYLVDRVQTDPAAPSIPEMTWTRLLRGLEPDDAVAVGRAADRQGDERHAERAWRVAAAAGDHQGETDLGLLLNASREFMLHG
jgi:eukaryotic-like serine/threonine-protein kinase